MVSAAFTVNGASNPAAHSTSYGATVNFALLSITGAGSITWTVESISESGEVPPSITPAGSPSGATASLVMPSNPGDGLGRTVLVKCLVTGANGVTAAQTAIVGVPNSQGRIPMAPGETTERDATHGWLPEINEALNGGAGSSGTTVALVAAKAASTGNVASLSGATTLDGISVVAGERVFLSAQSTGSQNGPWVVQSGAWTRPADFNESAEVIEGVTIAITQGATYGGKQFMLTSPGPYTLGTTSLTWTVVGGVSGTVSGAGRTPVYLLANSSITLSGLQTADGVSTGNGKRIGVISQSDPAQNGIWVSSSSGPWSRATDWTIGSTVSSGETFTVSSGTLFTGATVQVSTLDPIVVNTTALSFRVQPFLNTTGQDGLAAVVANGVTTLAKISDAHVNDNTLAASKIAGGGTAKRVLQTTTGGTPSMGQIDDGHVANSADIAVGKLAALANTFSGAALPKQAFKGSASIDLESSSGRNVLKRTDIVNLSDYVPKTGLKTGRGAITSGGTAFTMAGGNTTFANGDIVSIANVGAANTLTTPPTPTLTVVNQDSVVATTVYEYGFVYWNENWGRSVCSTTASITGPDILDAKNYIRVSAGTAASIPSDVYMIQVIRRTVTINGAAAPDRDWRNLGAIVPHYSSGPTNAQLCDQGTTFPHPNFVYVLTVAYPAIPTSVGRDRLHTSIVSGGGTVNLVLAHAAQATVGGSDIRTDVGPELQALIAANPTKEIFIEDGTWPIGCNIVFPSRRRLRGQSKYATLLSMAPGFNITVPYEAQYSRISNVEIIGQTKSLPHGAVVAPRRHDLAETDDGGTPITDTDTRYPGCGLYLNTECHVEDVTVQGIFGTGIGIRGSSTEDTNANRTKVINCDVNAPVYHGLFLSGGDSNVCKILGLSVVNVADEDGGRIPDGEISPDVPDGLGTNRNRGNADGILDSSFLGSDVDVYHFSGIGRPINQWQDTAASTYNHVYIEGGAQPSFVRSAQVRSGGDGGGYTPDTGGGSVQIGNAFTKPLNFVLRAVSASRWTANEPYRIGTRVRPTLHNGYQYEVYRVAGTSGPTSAIKDGISGSTEPTWPLTFGAIVTDGSGGTQITWRNVGQDRVFRQFDPVGYAATGNGDVLDYIYQGEDGPRVIAERAITKIFSSGGLTNGAWRLVREFDGAQLGYAGWRWQYVGGQYSRLTGLDHYQNCFSVGPDEANARLIGFVAGAAPNWNFPFDVGDVFHDTVNPGRRYTPAARCANTSVWTANTGYRLGACVRPTGGAHAGTAYVMVAVLRASSVNIGLSHATTEPTWNSTPGATFTDGSCVWYCWGSNTPVWIELGSIGTPRHLTGLTAATSATSLRATGHAPGQFVVRGSVSVMTADAAAGALNVVIGYTGRTGARTITVPLTAAASTVASAPLTAVEEFRFSETFYSVGSAAITISTALASGAFGTSVHALDAELIRDNAA